MSLTNRFSILLIVTLGLTLAGFSTALFILYRVYLDRQIGDRLTTILTLLKASAEVKPGWIRWDAREKRLPTNRWDERPASTWLVYDGSGRLITYPDRLPLSELPGEWMTLIGNGFPERMVDRRRRSWRVAWRCVKPSSRPAPPSERPTDTSEGKSYHDEVVLVAFASIGEAEAELRSLGTFLIALCASVLALATLCARRLSRTTLGPLTRLAASVRCLDATDPRWNLAEPGTRDELDDLARAFNELLARLHEAYDRQRRFSSEASHQLRTPVGVLMGHLEVAQRHERSGEEYRRVISLAHRRAVELGRIVESLLFLGRADSATLIRVEPIDLGRWLVAHAENRPSDCRSGDIIIDRESGGEFWAKAHPTLLGQMLENLLDNAGKYSPSGSPILVRLAHREGDVVLTVEDRGRGIAREDLPRIFEPFYRASAPASDRGTGLGLSVVRRIAEAFGGAVAVESELGRGSRFEVRLPVAEAPTDGPSAGADRSS
jgi:signal transduction histidine kinase